MHNIHYFAGSSTAQGFFSCFEHILPPSERRRMYFIKGGPGVGKSTLMRRVAQQAESKGLDVTYFHCSSDPDSLDGICIPALGMGMMDGTAPHVYDPVLPGARDILLSLGDYLDADALAPHTAEIAHVQQLLSQRFARCFRYLAAAKEVLCACPACAINDTAGAQLLESWVHSLPLRGGTGSIRRYFASAFTPRGLWQVTDFSLMERCVTLEVPFGSFATDLLHTLSLRAAARGLDVVTLADPLDPAQTAHVLIPAHGIAFCTARQAPQHGEWVDALFAPQEATPELSFDRNAYELLCQRAVEQLSQAKALHDQLESFYIKNMDFLAWQTVLDRVLAQL